jgi:hypothetical protein
MQITGKNERRKGGGNNNNRGGNNNNNFTCGNDAPKTNRDIYLMSSYLDL